MATLSVVGVVWLAISWLSTVFLLFGGFGFELFVVFQLAGGYQLGELFGYGLPRPGDFV